MRSSSRMFASMGAVAMALASGLGMAVGAPSNVSTDPMNPKPPQSRRSAMPVSDETVRRRRMKRRWLAGQPIPTADKEALDRAQAIRERKNAKRAYMFRRQEEGRVLNAECTAYYARLNEITGPSRTATNDECEAAGWDRIKRLLELWDDKQPLEIVLGATAN